MDLHIIVTQRPWFAFKFTLVVHSMRGDTCIMTGIHHCSIILSSFTAPKSPLFPANSFIHSLPTACMLSHVQLFLTCQVSLAHGIFQARILEWVSRPSSAGSSRPRDQRSNLHLKFPALAGIFFTTTATLGTTDLSLLFCLF